MKSTTFKVTLLIFLLLINYTSSLSAVIVNGDKHVNIYRRQGSKTSASAPPATSSNKSSGPSESSGKAQDAPSSTTNQQLPTPPFQTEKQKLPTSPSTQDQPTSPKSTDQQPSSTLPSTSEQSNPPSSSSTPDQSTSLTSTDQQSSPTSIYQPPPPTSPDQQQKPSQTTPQQITNAPITPQQPIETITAAATTASNVAGINQQQLTTSFSTHTSVFPGYNMTTSTTNSNGQVVSFETYIPPSTKVVVEQIVTKLPDNSASSGNSLLNNLKNSNNYYMFISLFVIPCIILCF